MSASIEPDDNDVETHEDSLRYVNNRLFNNSKLRDPVEEEQKIIVEYDENSSTSFSFKKLAVFMGPGFLMSIAYLDPGNIESDLQAGVVSGYNLLWLLLVAHGMGFLLQCLAIRLGVLTGNHLAEVCRAQYHVVPRIVLWIMVEIAIIGSDMQEVIGTAIALYILSDTKIPIWAGVLLTIVDTFTFLFLDKYGLRKLEAFFCFLIGVMAVMFGMEYFWHLPNQVEVVKGFVPGLGDWNTSTVVQAVGMIGAVIMPHNFYLHSALVRSREVDRKNKGAVKEATKYNSIESGLALICSFVINFFVVCVFANAYYFDDDPTHKCKEPIINDNVDIYSAGNYLECKFGSAMKYIWAIGILAAGQSSTMTGTYSGQFVMEGFINIRLPRWQRVLLTRSIAIFPTIILAAVSSNNIGTLSNMNDVLNVLQSMMLPFALLPILQFTNDKKIMGWFRSPKSITIVIWGLAFLVFGINIYLIFATVISFQLHSAYIALVVVLYLAYSSVVLYFLLSALNITWMSRFFPYQIEEEERKLVENEEVLQNYTGPDVKLN